MTTINDNYLIVYTQGIIRMPAKHTITEVLERIMDLSESGAEPTHIILPSGIQVNYNAYVANAFIAKGRINEEYYIELSTAFSFN